MKKLIFLLLTFFVVLTTTAQEVRHTVEQTSETEWVASYTKNDVDFIELIYTAHPELNDVTISVKTAPDHFDYNSFSSCMSKAKVTCLSDKHCVIHSWSWTNPAFIAGIATACLFGWLPD